MPVADGAATAARRGWRRRRRSRWSEICSWWRRQRRRREQQWRRRRRHWSATAVQRFTGCRRTPTDRPPSAAASPGSNRIVGSVRSKQDFGQLLKFDPNCIFSAESLQFCSKVAAIRFWPQFGRTLIVGRSATASTKYRICREFKWPINRQ